MISKFKIITFAINPSTHGLDTKRMSWDISRKLSKLQILNENDKSEFINMLNSNFDYPLEQFFQPIEKVLNIFDSSYTRKSKERSIAIHIDINTALITNPIWRGLSDSQKKQVSNIDLSRLFINYLKPDIIVCSVNSDTLFNAFPEYKEIREYRYKKVGYIKVWKNNHGNLIIQGRNGGSPFAYMSDEFVKKTVLDIKELYYNEIE